jgi:hypothetical protein
MERTRSIVPTACSWKCPQAEAVLGMNGVLLEAQWCYCWRTAPVFSTLLTPLWKILAAYFWLNKNLHQPSTCGRLLISVSTWVIVVEFFNLF